jgi:hypothetical protein
MQKGMSNANTAIAQIRNCQLMRRGMLCRTAGNLCNIGECRYLAVRWCDRSGTYQSDKCTAQTNADKVSPNHGANLDCETGFEY